MIHIIMSTYNGELYIEEQIQSIIDNTNKDWKLYIVDDNSIDRTLDIVDTMKERANDRIVVEKNNINKGVSANFFSKIQRLLPEMSIDDYIMFCDQDDVWLSQKIDITLKQMRSLEQQYTSNIPLLVCSDVTVVNQNLNVISESFAKMNHYNINQIDIAHLMMENKVQGCTMMINRKLCEKIKRVPEKIIMYDAWIGLIAASMGHIAYISNSTMLYRQHENNVIGSDFFWKDMVHKITNLAEQRKIVYRTTEQVKDFLQEYGNELSYNMYEVIQKFSNLSHYNWIRRRITIIKYHMWKSSVLRNIGLMILV